MKTSPSPLGAPAAPAQHALLTRWVDAAEWLTPHTVLALLHRAAIASIFWRSARTKVEGWFSISDGAYALFREEYRVPLLAPELAAQLATVAEHVFALLLALGLFTRLSAVALLGMTLVIQVFVYPGAWPTHLSWAALMLYLVGRGAGRLSLDHAFGIR